MGRLAHMLSMRWGVYSWGERRWGPGAWHRRSASWLGAQKWSQDTTLLMSVCSGSSGVSSIGQELSLRTLDPGRGKAKGNGTSFISHKPARALVGTTHRAESGLLIFQKRWQPWHSGHGVNGGLRPQKALAGGTLRRGQYPDGGPLLGGNVLGGNAYAGVGGGPGGGASSRCRNAEGTPWPCVRQAALGAR